jgi:hypothetical protein
MKLSLPGALFILFLTLKLCGVIGWSWWWITAPLWIFPAALLVFLGAIVSFHLRQPKKQGDRR